MKLNLDEETVYDNKKCTSSLCLVFGGYYSLHRRINEHIYLLKIYFDDETPLTASCEWDRAKVIQHESSSHNVSLARWGHTAVLQSIPNNLKNTSETTGKIPPQRMVVFGGVGEEMTPSNHLICIRCEDVAK